MEVQEKAAIRYVPKSVRRQNGHRQGGIASGLLVTSLVLSAP
jgi:hypothetical protein